MRHPRRFSALAVLILLAAAGHALAQVTPAPSFEAALKAAQENNQLLVLDFYSDW